MYLARGLQTRLQRAIASAPLVILEGARSVGKTYLVDHAVREGWLTEIRSFLNPAELDAARTAPRDYVFELPHGTAIDEVQICEDILLPVKERVEQSGPGSLLLTGSTRLRRDQLGGSDPLAGRVGSPLHLGPLTLGEREGQPVQVVAQLFGNDPSSITVGRATARSDLIDLVQQVGMPGMRTVESTMQDDMAGAYLRQVTSLSNFESLDIRRVGQLARFLAGRTSTPVNVQRFHQEVGFERRTIEKYMARLEEALIIHRLPGWRRSKAKSETERAKVHFFDVGIACSAARMQPALQSQDLGQLVESLVVTELIRQCQWLWPTPRCYHWRRSQRHEVDLVIENHEGRAVCVEVKTSERVQASDFSAIDEFRRAYPAEFQRGFIFYSGTHVLPFGDDRWAIPFAALRAPKETAAKPTALNELVAATRVRERAILRRELNEAHIDTQRQQERQQAVVREVEVQLEQLASSLSSYDTIVEPSKGHAAVRFLRLRPTGIEGAWSNLVNVQVDVSEIRASTVDGKQSDRLREPFDDRPPSEIVAALLAGAAKDIGAALAALDIEFGL